MNLPPGTYAPTATLSGFSKALREDLIMRAGLNLVVDIVMKVGVLEATLTVVAESPLLETSNPGQAVNVSGEMAQSVPLAARRHWSEFLRFTPGAVVGDGTQNRTGETRGARSSYRGDGIYKSEDAGETWTNMGLHDSHHISRVVIHPTNADIVYAAVMGHLYSANEERGVFKSVDGGRTWKRSFFVNDKLGVIDLVMNPQTPDVLYAGTCWRRRIRAQPDAAAVDEGGVQATRRNSGRLSVITW